MKVAFLNCRDLVCRDLVRLCRRSVRSLVTCSPKCGRARERRRWWASPERQEAEVRESLEATCRAAVAEAEAAARRLWAVHGPVAPLVRRRDELTREIRSLRGEPPSPWTDGSTLGWVFPRVPGTGERAEDLAEILGGVAVDVTQLARKRQA